MSELSEKQKLFCNIYLKNGMNAKRAYIQAGYSEKTAEQASSRLLSNVKVSEYIALKQQKTAKKLDIDREFILKELLDIKRRTLEEDPANGKFPQYQHALKAIEQIAKMLGLNEPEKIEITGSNLVEAVPAFGDE